VTANNLKNHHAPCSYRARDHPSTLLA
jgi:hypothetical protein